MSATTNLDRYRPISSLGSGGMSTVVLAEDTVLGRRVALKRMHAGDDARRRLSRLRREALIGASVSHPNLVPIYDIVTVPDGDSVIVMEYVEGQTLRDRVKREGALPIALALRVLEGVAAALDTIHAQGIVHRDVKPANILLGNDGSIKLADLGVASAPDRTRITTTGGVVGTFSYMSPEQLGGAAATPATDIYALAAVAFEALSGRKARTEPNPLALAHAIAKGPPPDLRDAWPQAPPAAAKLLMRGMARNPKDRPKSAGEFAGRLREALAPAVTAPAPASARPARTAAARAAAAGAAAAAGPAAAPPSRARPARAGTASARDRLAPQATAADEPAPPIAEPAAGPEGRNRRRILAATLIPLVALAAAIAAIAATSGSSPHRQAAVQSHSASTRRSAPAHTATARRHSATSSARTTSPSTQRATRPAAVAPPVATHAAGAPAAAVERFYTLAAAHDYSAAWGLTDSAFRRQLGGYQGLQGTMARVRSITFDSARTVSQGGGSATVAVRTTSVQTDRTQHCSGTVQLVPSGAGWLLHQIAISCV